MLTLDLPCAELAFRQANRCLFCLFKLSKSAQKDKPFPVTEFNDAWSHLVPDEEIEFSVTPPICPQCETTLKKLYKALMQLTEATIAIKETVTKSGRNGSSLEEEFAKLLEDLKQSGIEDRYRRGALALLERIGHEEVFEEDYQAWFPKEVETIGFKSVGYADETLIRDPDPESDAGSPFDEGGESQYGVDSGPDDDLTSKTTSPLAKFQAKSLKSPSTQKPRRPNQARKLSRVRTKRRSRRFDDGALEKKTDSASDHQSDTDYVPEQKKAKAEISERIKRTRTSRRGLRSKPCRGYLSRRNVMVKKKSFTCDYCLQYIPVDTLREHIRSHVGDYIINCPNSDCPRAFTTTSQLMDHARHRHNCRRVVSAKDYLTCECCGHLARTPHHLLNHLLSYHEEEKKDFTCPVETCAESYSTRQAVQCHIRHHTSVYRRAPGALAAPLSHQRCCDCRMDIHEDKMKDHLESYHQIPSDSIVYCHVCPYLFTNWNRLLDHFKIHMRKDGELTCSLCPTGKFNQLSLLRQHYFGKHQIGSPLTCDKCPYSCWSQTGMFHHTRNIHDQLPKPKEYQDSKPRLKFQCDQCPKTLHRKTDLVAHKIQDHGEDPLECDICSEKFGSSRELTYHRNEVHLGVVQQRKRPYSNPVMCNQCGKVLKHVHSLTKHMKVVHSNPAFACAVCGKRFKDVRNLKKHEGSELCKKREMLQNPSSADVDPSVCLICDKRFTSKYTKAVHDREVHSGQAFTCDKCGRSFVTERTMKAHQNRKLCRNTALGQNSKQTQLKYQGAEYTVQRKVYVST